MASMASSSMLSSSIVRQIQFRTSCFKKKERFLLCVSHTFFLVGTMRVLLVGGGHCHALLIRSLALNPQSYAYRLQVTLISPDRYSYYSGMIPGSVRLLATSTPQQADSIAAVYGAYSEEQVQIDLERLCEWSNVVLVIDTVVRIDPTTCTVYCQSG